MVKVPDSEAKKRWDKENTVMLSIKFQKKTDSDILEYLDSASNSKTTKQTTIKAALREYMERHPLSAGDKETDDDWFWEGNE